MDNPDNSHRDKCNNVLDLEKKRCRKERGVKDVKKTSPTALEPFQIDVWKSTHFPYEQLGIKSLHKKCQILFGG